MIKPKPNGYGVKSNLSNLMSCPMMWTVWFGNCLFMNYNASVFICVCYSCSYILFNFPWLLARFVCETGVWLSSRGKTRNNPYTSSKNYLVITPFHLPKTYNAQFISLSFKQFSRPQNDQWSRLTLYHPQQFFKHFQDCVGTLKGQKTKYSAACWNIKL